MVLTLSFNIRSELLWSQLHLRKINWFCSFVVFIFRIFPQSQKDQVNRVRVAIVFVVQLRSSGTVRYDHICVWRSHHRTHLPHRCFQRGRQVDVAEARLLGRPRRPPLPSGVMPSNCLPRLWSAKRSQVRWGPQLAAGSDVAAGPFPPRPAAGIPPTASMESSTLVFGTQAQVPCPGPSGGIAGFLNCWPKSNPGMPAGWSDEDQANGFADIYPRLALVSGCVATQHTHRCFCAMSQDNPTQYPNGPAAATAVWTVRMRCVSTSWTARDGTVPGLCGMKTGNYTEKSPWKRGNPDRPPIRRGLCNASIFAGLKRGESGTIVPQQNSPEPSPTTLIPIPSSPGHITQRG